MPNFSNIVIFSQGRSGSSYLTELIGNHSQNKTLTRPNHGCEIVHEDFSYLWTHSSQSKYFEEYIASHSCDKNLVVKIHYHHCEKDLAEWFNQSKNTKLVEIDRRNKLEQLVSLILSQNTNMWYGSQYPSFSFPITFNRLSKFVENLEKEKSRVRNLITTPIHPIMYEDLCVNEKEQMKRTFDFLDLPYEQTKIWCKKQQVQTLESRIKNYEELKKQCEQTSFAEYFT